MAAGTPLDSLQGSLTCTANWQAQQNIKGDDMANSPIENDATIQGQTLYSQDGASVPGSLVSNEVARVVVAVPAGSSVTIDLTSVYNILNQVGGLVAFARITGLLFRLPSLTQDTTIGSMASSVRIGNTPSNGNQMFLNGTTDSILLQNGMWAGGGWNSSTGQPVDGTHKNILFTNNDNTNPANVEMVVYGNNA